MIINNIEQPAIIKIITGKGSLKILELKNIKEIEHIPNDKFCLYTEDKESQEILNSFYGAGPFNLNLCILTANDNIIIKKFLLMLQNNNGRFGGKYYFNILSESNDYPINEKEKLELKIKILRNDKRSKN